MAQTFDTIEKYPGLSMEEARQALDAACAVAKADLGEFTDHFPSSNSFGGFYEPTENGYEKTIREYMRWMRE